MAEDKIPPTPPGFRPQPWEFGGGAPAQNYYAPPAPPANDEELKRLRAENERLRAAQQAPQQVDDVESRLRAEYQDTIAQAMSRIKKLRTENKQYRSERDAAVAECDALRKRNASLEAAARRAVAKSSDSYEDGAPAAPPQRRRRAVAESSDAEEGSAGEDRVDIPPVEAIGDLVAEMAEFVADNAPEDVQNAYACSLHPSDYLRRWARGDTLLRPLRGLNVQLPWAPMLLDGSKVIEARTYDIDDKGGFGNEWFWLVETPGKQRRRGQRARITGCVKFCSEAVRYTSLDQWRADEDKHRIAAGSDYDWDGRGAMYGWRVERVMVLREPVPGPDRKGTINSKPIPRLVPRDGWVVA